MERKGFTIWFTGLSGSGKSTLAQKLERELRKRGFSKIEILDGDIVRTHLSKGLGFSREDRDTNIRRIGFVCKLLSRNGVIAISAAISPYRDIRDYNRKEIGDFIEVYCKCSLNDCIERDVKGLYKKALAVVKQTYTQCRA
jgi:adenylyl-sulfate kinase